MKALSLLMIALFFSIGLITASETEGTPPDVPKSTPDEAVVTRLHNIFVAIEELKNVSVSASAGVVTLSGRAADLESAQQALELTKKTEGVVYVVNRIDENVEVRSRLQPAIDKARELGTDTLRKLPLIAIAIVVIALAWLVGSWLRKQNQLFRRLGINQLASDLLGRCLKLLVIGLGIFIALEILNATAIAAAILGVAGVAGIALGFAFRNIVENYLAGILLSLRNPFQTGDAVKIDNFTGKVVRLTSRDTVLMTFDGNHLRLPNSLIMTSALTNFSRNPLRRFDFAVGVSVELDLVKVRQLGIDTLSSIEAILDDPAPSVVIEALGDSTVNMRFFAWIDQKESDFLKTKSEAIRLVKDTFDDNEIEMPEPIYRVVMKNTDAAPAEKKDKPTRAQVELDTKPDRSIDEQVQKAHLEDDESNLLTES